MLRVSRFLHFNCFGEDEHRLVFSAPPSCHLFYPSAAAAEVAMAQSEAAVQTNAERQAQAGTSNFDLFFLTKQVILILSWEEKDN